MKTKFFSALLLFLLLFSCANDGRKKISANPTEEQSDATRTTKTIPESPELKIHESNFRILPVDESSTDKSLKQFVAGLKEIIRKKDLNAFVSCLDTGIVVSWGGGIYGVKTFLEEWKLDKHPERSELWPTLKRYLTLGGAWEEDKKQVRFPYAQCDRFFRNMDLDFDWYFTAVCISPKTIVYQKAIPDAEKTALLSYEVVKIIQRGDDFIEVQTIDKKITGFVKSEQIILSGASHPILEKVNNEWKIVSFAPFD